MKRNQPSPFCSSETAKSVVRIHQSRIHNIFLGTGHWCSIL